MHLAALDLYSGGTGTQFEFCPGLYRPNKNDLSGFKYFTKTTWLTGRKLTLLGRGNIYIFQ
jgi:hypothetical protein